MDTFDVAVIGGGTAGPSAARTARSRGMSVAVIEQDRFGGCCLWWACVPTKTLIECGKVYRQTLRGGMFGTRAADVALDYPQVQARKEAVIARIAEHDAPEHLEREGITVLHAHASFESPHEIRAGDQVMRAEHVVLAIGSLPRVPAVPGLAEVEYLTNLTAISLRHLPPSMLILGGGPVGCEFAQMFTRFGVEITLVQRRERVLPREDADSSRVAQQVLAREGVRILVGASAKRVEKRNGGVALTIEAGGAQRELAAGSLLVATGREVPLAALNPEAAGLTVREGKLEVQDTLQTNVAHIWACGDAASKMIFTHVAEHQGQHVGRNLGLAAPAAWDDRVVPRATFLDPEVASVGLTEEQAAKQYDVVVGNVPFSASDRAVIQDETTGFVKIVADRESGQILGAHIVGPRAGDIIHELAAAMAGRVPVKVIGETIHLYPSLLDPLRWAAQEAEAKRARPETQRKAA